MILAKSRTKIGPLDHGRKMSLKDFEFVKVEPGLTCELQKGYIIVSEVASYFLAMQIIAIMRPLWAIVDAKLERALVLRRGKSDWIEKAQGPDGTIETKLLRGFKLSCRTIFEAAREQENAE